MSYSRKQLYAFGETFGESATQHKLGGRIYGGGSSPAAAPTATSQTINQTSIPEYAQPYVESMLGKTQALTNTPTPVYQGQQNANFTGLQQQAQQGAANMTPSWQTDAASGLAGAAGLGALNTQYQGTQAQNQFQSPDQYNAAPVSMYQAQAPDLQQYQMGAAPQAQAAQAQGVQTGYDPSLNNYQMGPAQQVGVQSFAAPGASSAYMSPYMQGVVNVQQQEAQRQADIATTGRNAQATQSGAFGGGRQAITDAEAARNLATQQGSIQATGLQNAYQQAQTQFNTEQASGLQAQQANQQANLATGQANLQSNLGVQQLGTQTGLSTALANQQTSQNAGMQNAQFQQQAGLANQQAGLTTGQANLQAQLGTQQLGSGQSMQAQLANQSTLQNAQQLAAQQQQFGASNAMTGAQTAAQYGQAAQQQNAQQQQFGASLGLQGLSTALQGAGQLGTLGAQDYTQQTGINALQQQTGATQQAQQQALLNTQYQNYLTQQQAPYQQLSYMSDMLRGLPMSQSTQSLFQAPPTTAATAAGLGTAAIGASQLLKAKGGAIKTPKQRPAGLAELAISKMA